jgi:hypothetical protein
MKNFKMMLPENEVKQTLKTEVDSTYLLAVTLKDEYSVKDYLRKFKENKHVDLYTEFHHFFPNELDRRQIMELVDIEVIAFSLTENSFVLKLNEYNFRNVSDVRKEKIKTLLK